MEQGGVVWQCSTPITETFTNHLHDPEDSNTIIHDTVQALYVDDNGIIWCGTAGGLSRYDYALNQFTNYTMREGLSGDSIYGLLGSKDGTIWLSTGHGISHFNPENETFENYDVLDGLQSNQFNLFASYRAENGELFFGGPNGLNSFYPDHYSKKHLPASSCHNRFPAFQPLAQIPEAN